MKTLTVCLPEIAHAKAMRNALELGVNIEVLCSSTLADQLLPLTGKDGAEGEKSVSMQPPSCEAVGRAKPTGSRFDVAEYFPDFPRGSVELAQGFVNEAVKQPGVTAFKNKRGIGFKPNFVFIEYLMSRGGKCGIGVSFYGEPHRHKDVPEILVKGIPSYSRAKIYSKDDLNAILPHIKQSFDLRFGGLA